ncbi:MAG TPA: hypothetical protein VGG39_11200 [Polyangiaceae bacterium]|jgi:hypothetical protein
MRKLPCLVLLLVPFLGACASFGVGNPQTEWTTTEGVGDPPVSNIEAPETPAVPDEVWVPYVPVDPAHHREHEHVAESGSRPASHEGSHVTSHTGGGSSSNTSHHAR